MGTLAVAGQLLRMGKTAQEVARTTGLTVEQVKAVGNKQRTKRPPPPLEEKLNEAPFEHALMRWIDDD